MYNFLHYRILLNITSIDHLFLAKMPTSINVIKEKKKTGNESMTRKELLKKTKLTLRKMHHFYITRK